MKILLTGAAGFIGFHLANKLLKNNFEVVGLDSINDYYDVNLKLTRLETAGIQRTAIKYNSLVDSKNYNSYRFIQLNLEDKENLDTLFEKEKFDYVINLAAQAGVRYSLINPGAYLKSNMEGFLNILENCRHQKVKHLVYASSSSVYGLNQQYPFSTHDNVDHPISLYAASKKSNELMAHTYSYLFGLPTSGLRFFTVYGPWGRPDMALFLFTKAIIEGKPIEVFNNGQMERDFTYIDDIVEGVFGLMNAIPQGNKNWKAAEPDPSSSPAPYKVFNIGNSQPVQLMDFVKAIEKEIGKKAEIIFKPMQAGDVQKTWADTTDLEATINYKPATPIEVGVKNFISWYKEYFK